MIYLLIHSSLALTTFLLVLNTFLRGVWKENINIVLSLLLIALLITCFVFFGWKAGIVALILTFLYGAVSRSLAVRLAARIHTLPGEPPPNFIGLPPAALERISQEIRPSNLSEEMGLGMVVSRSDKYQRAREDLLNYCEERAEIQEILKEFNASRATLEKLYTQLTMAGAGQWRGGHYVAASAIAYPQTLRFLLKHQSKGDLPVETAWKLLMYFEKGAALD
jgi:hypothetical protein